MEQNTNFWQDLSDSWREQGKNFLLGLPKFVGEQGLNLGSSWLAGLIENRLDFASYRAKADYQYQLSEKMAANAYNRQLDFWNKQNAYNTPQAMVGRMADAGLNPAQSITPQPAGDLSSVSTPMPSASSSRPNIASGMESFGQILKAVKELGLLDKETEIKAKELVSKQLDNTLKEIARASGFSDAMIKEMDRRAQWETIYGEDVPVPENPYVKDLFPMSIERNPHTQNYVEGENRIKESEGRQAEQNIVNANLQREYDDRHSLNQKTIAQITSQIRNDSLRTKYEGLLTDANLRLKNQEFQYKEDINPLLVRAQELSNSIAEATEQNIITQEQGNAILNSIKDLEYRVHSGDASAKEIFFYYAKDIMTTLNDNWQNSKDRSHQSRENYYQRQADLFDRLLSIADVF